MDKKLFRAINQFSGHFFILDHVMIFFSNFIRYIYVILIIILGLKCRNKNIFKQTGISVLISLLINNIIRLFFYKDRPFIKKRVGVLIPSKLDSSFPSKHTLLVFAVSTIALFYHRILGLIMLWMSIITGLSRIWVGHHYPSDIIGSAALGSGVSIIVKCLSIFRFRSLFKSCIKS